MRRWLLLSGVLLGTVVRLGVVAGVPAAEPVVAAVPAALAPPSGSTTTVPRVPPVIVVPSTSRPATTSTSTTVWGDSTIAEPDITSASTTVPGGSATPRPPVPDAIAASTVPPPPPPISAVAVATTAAPLPVAAATTSTVPTSSGDQIALGGLSTDPADWSDEVVDHLVAQGVNVDALGASVAHDQPGALLSNAGCAVQCITDGVAYAVGTGAHLRVNTSVPATIRISLFGQQPAVVDSGASTTGWGYTWPGLESEWTYTALASATDAQGNQAFASGDFTTLSRFVAVQVVGFEGQPVLPYEHFHARGWLDGAVHFSVEGDHALPWGGATFAPVQSTIELVLEGRLHDHDHANSCLVQAADGIPTEPVENCAYITGVVATNIALDTYPETATSWTEHTIDTAVWTAGQPFGFEAQLEVSVTYAAAGEYP